MNVRPAANPYAPVAPSAPEAAGRLASLRALQKALEIQSEPAAEKPAETEVKGQLLDIRC